MGQPKGLPLTNDRQSSTIRADIRGARPFPSGRSTRASREVSATGPGAVARGFPRLRETLSWPQTQSQSVVTDRDRALREPRHS